MKNSLYKAENHVDFITQICEQISLQCKKAISEKNRALLVLSGGRTPIAIFELLASNYSSKIDWEKVDLFWLDERCVDPSDELSNFGSTKKYLIDRLEVIGNVYRMKGELDPALAAIEYENQLRNYFGGNIPVFDIILLGMGEDGHVASLFPNCEELENRDRWVLSTSKPHNGCYRITLSMDLINNAKFKLLMVNSVEKLNILLSEEARFPINCVKIPEIYTFAKFYH
ncbi:6-phosphogluconolactonase [Reichenbachiella faecimaris]|uniref:6-phosphogluconolactonase n=1 Tax=Reichenbachiella faecimaris TaxID=692418 RepID=A0A1W2GCG1_REIFA|nr:6-phosphogluconolactonase [Reichenbachiella faecimaris]SMD34360.1 6-phosphogluconolactonase [Reichenbachiella faecimaris]